MKKRKTDNSCYAAAGLLGVLIIILSLTFLERTSSKPPSFGKPPSFDCFVGSLYYSHDAFREHSDSAKEVACLEKISDLPYSDAPSLVAGFIGGTCVYEVGQRYYFEKRLRDAVAAGCFK